MVQTCGTVISMVKSDMPPSSRRSSVSDADAAAAGVVGSGAIVPPESERCSPSGGLDLGRADDLAPLFGFLGDQLAEVGGRPAERGGAQVREARLQLRIGEARIHQLVELLDDVGGRVLRRAQAVPAAGLVAG